MLKTELLEIIANGENSGMGFKRDDIRPEQLAREIVAMTNFQGGRVILGVEDDGTISGIQRENTEEWVMKVMRDKVHPLEPEGLCTVAGLLLFGKQPRRYLKQAGLRVLVFDSQDKECRAKLDVILDAPLVGRWDGTESSEKTPIDHGLLERCLTQITTFVTQELDDIDENFRRTTKWLYPRDAVREVLVNALAHFENNEHRTANVQRSTFNVQQGGAIRH